MPKQAFQNPLYQPRYNDPNIGAIGGNIAGLILGRESPNDAADRAAKDALMADQGESARQSGRKTGIEADIANLLLGDIRDPRAAVLRRGASMEGLTPDQQAQGATLWQSRINNKDPANIAKAENLNRDVASLLLDPTQAGAVGTRNAAVEGKPIYGEGGEGQVLQHFTGDVGQTPVSQSNIRKADAAATKDRADAAAGPKSIPVTPVTIVDPKDPNRTIVIDGRTRETFGEGPKLSQVGGADQKLHQKLPQAKQRVKTMTDNINQLADDMQSLHNDPGLPNITGPVAGRTWNVTDTATNAQNKLDSIKSKIFVTALQSMREASKTGGAVGNVSDREGDKLERTLVGLNQSQGTPSFQENLEKAITQLHNSRDILNQAFEDEYGSISEGAGNTAPAFDADKERRYQEWLKANP